MNAYDFTKLTYLRFFALSLARFSFFFSLMRACFALFTYPPPPRFPAPVGVARGLAYVGFLSFFACECCFLALAEAAPGDLLALTALPALPDTPEAALPFVLFAVTDA